MPDRLLIWQWLAFDLMSIYPGNLGFLPILG
jgi:hypothetical protein